MNYGKDATLMSFATEWAIRLEKTMRNAKCKSLSFLYGSIAQGQFKKNLDSMLEAFDEHGATHSTVNNDLIRQHFQNWTAKVNGQSTYFSRLFSKILKKHVLHGEPFVEEVQVEGVIHMKISFPVEEICDGDKNRVKEAELEELKREVPSLIGGVLGTDWIKGEIG